MKLKLLPIAAAVFVSAPALGLQQQQPYPLLQEVVYRLVDGNRETLPLMDIETGLCITSPAKGPGHGSSPIVTLGECIPTQSNRLILHESGMLEDKRLGCVALASDARPARQGDQLAFDLDSCNADDDRFTFTAHGELRHDDSGLCLGTETRKTMGTAVKLTGCEAGGPALRLASMAQQGMVLRHSGGQCVEPRDSSSTSLLQVWAFAGVAGEAILSGMCGARNNYADINMLPNGSLMHAATGRCLSPTTFGTSGDAGPPEHTPLAFARDCSGGVYGAADERQNQIEFKLQADGRLLHVASGMCVTLAPDDANSPQPMLALTSNCDAGNNTFHVSVPASLCPAGAADSDGDSLCDAAELRYGTDPYDTDTDGDSLSDGAELLGWSGVALAAAGANPLHKDVFVEVDYYPGLAPMASALRIVEDAFRNAPVNNPSNMSGVNLHIDLASSAIDSADAIEDLFVEFSPPYHWLDFERIKARYFDANRSDLYHYAIFANRFNSAGYSGVSRGIGARDFLVTLGTWPTRGGTEAEQAGTFMHELGHNLGLFHGGDENVNGKLNYLSIMSYNYQLWGLRVDGAPAFDFSRLNINAIGPDFDEASALSGFAGTTEAELARYTVMDSGGNPYPGTASANLDFNRNGIIESGVYVDPQRPSQHDWANLVFSGGNDLHIGDGLLGIRTLEHAAGPSHAGLSDPSALVCLSADASSH